MAKYFQPMPGGFTNNFFFEFDKGVCTVFERADTPNSEAWRVIMFPTLEECQECLKICSVPSRYLQKLFLTKFKLPRHQGNDLPQKKVLWMAKNYCTIPTDKLFITLFYRTPPETLAEQKEKEEDETATVAQLVNKHKWNMGPRSGQQKPHKALTNV